ncbi:hypothetical protein VYU27_010549 [Nannochloropsis oceanica]
MSASGGEREGEAAQMVREQQEEGQQAIEKGREVLGQAPSPTTRLVKGHHPHHHRRSLSNPTHLAAAAVLSLSSSSSASSSSSSFSSSPPASSSSSSSPPSSTNPHRCTHHGRSLTPPSLDSFSLDEEHHLSVQALAIRNSMRRAGSYLTRDEVKEIMRRGRERGGGRNSVEGGGRGGGGERGKKGRKEGGAAATAAAGRWLSLFR